MPDPKICRACISKNGVSGTNLDLECREVWTCKALAYERYVKNNDSVGTIYVRRADRPPKLCPRLFEQLLVGTENA